MDKDWQNARIIFLTPFHGKLSDLSVNIVQQLKRMCSPFEWVIVLDRCVGTTEKLPSNTNITILENDGQPGAGNARNIGLHYICENVEPPFVLVPIDGDDFITNDAMDKFRQSVQTYSEKIISFGHVKKNNLDEQQFGYDGVFEFHDLLKKYTTPCGSTLLKVDTIGDIQDLKFGERKRANDQLLSAVKKFGTFRNLPDVTLIYNIGRKSLSSGKYKMGYYKYLSLRDIGLSQLYSIYLLFYYAFNGIKRHLFGELMKGWVCYEIRYL